MNIARSYSGGSGTTSAALAFGGTPSGTATEEFSGGGPATLGITTT
jgi:hypothetical protein